MKARPDLCFLTSPTCTSAELAPGDDTNLTALTLTDPERRPSEPRRPLPPARLDDASCRDGAPSMICDPST